MEKLQEFLPAINSMDTALIYLVVFIFIVFRREDSFLKSRKSLGGR